MFDIPIGYICSNNYASIRAKDTLETAYEKIGSKKTKILVVFDNDNKIIGVLNYYDIMKYSYESYANTKVESAMSINPVILHKDTGVKQAYKIIKKNQISSILVGDTTNLFGTVGLLDFKVFKEITNNKGLINNFDYYKMNESAKKYYEDYCSFLNNIDLLITSFQKTKQDGTNLTSTRKVLKIVYSAMKKDIFLTFKRRMPKQNENVFYLIKKIQDYMNIMINIICREIQDEDFLIKSSLDNISYVYNSESVYREAGYLYDSVYELIDVLNKIMDDIDKRLKEKKDNPYLIKDSLMNDYKIAFYNCLCAKNEMKLYLDNFLVVYKSKLDLDASFLAIKSIIDKKFSV